MVKTKKSQAFPKRPSCPNIVIYNRQKDLALSTRLVKSWVKTLFETVLSTSCGEVAIHFVTEKKICELHRDFFNDPTPTDCISFPLLSNEMLGEVFVCPKTARHYALKHQKDPYQETALYIIHGLLHLLGYDDLSTKERRLMRREEKRCLQQLLKHGFFSSSVSSRQAH